MQANYCVVREEPGKQPKVVYTSVEFLPAEHALDYFTARRPDLDHYTCTWEQAEAKGIAY